MKKNLSILILALIGSSTINAQFSMEYNELASEANNKFCNDEFLDAANTYSKAFLLSGDMKMTNHRYNASLCYALAGQIDSAFVHLEFLSNHRTYDSYTYKMEERLNNLKDDSRWEIFINKLDSNYILMNKRLDSKLVSILDTVEYLDQNLRLKFDCIASKYGEESDEMESLYVKQKVRDQENVKTVSNLLDKNGWMGFDKIGSHVFTVFVVIQHAELDVQERYLPLFKEARERNEVDPSTVAFIEDRINVNKGIPQLYGTQFTTDENGKTTFYEIFEPENINERRESVGLGPIEEY